MSLSRRRIPWTFVAGAILFAGLLALTSRYWGDIRIKAVEAMMLVQSARPGWLVMAVMLIGLGFLCAGQIYGRILSALGYKAQALWLSAAALVALMLSQVIPAGSFASYAFLTASLRRRGIPGASVAIVASLELLSWLGAMLLMALYGLTYILLTTGDSTVARACLTGMTTALVVLGSYIFVGSRPHATLHDWGMRFKRAVDRVFGPIWHDTQIARLVDDIAANRQVVMEQPLRLLLLVCLQVTISLLHSMALLAVLYSLGFAVSLPAVAAAYGLALIVSAFTLFPGGGGTVEGALVLTLTIQGVPLEAALGAAVLFRLFSFWLLLPIGAVSYRMLIR